MMANIGLKIGANLYLKGWGGATKQYFAAPREQ
jgi:hypothetical protein